MPLLNAGVLHSHDIYPTSFRTVEFFFLDAFIYHQGIVLTVNAKELSILGSERFHFLCTESRARSM